MKSAQRDGSTPRLITNMPLGFFFPGLLPEPGEPGRSGASEPHDPIPTYGAEEERQDVRLWRTVIIGEQEHRINMKVIEPYMRVISHGGEDAASRRPPQKVYSKL